MTRAALYSRSRYRPGAVAGAQVAAPPPPSRRARLLAFGRRFERALLVAGALAAAFVAVGLYALMHPATKPLTQTDIDSAVAHSLKTRPADPSHASIAYDVIGPSVVLVRRLGKEGDAGKDKPAHKSKTPPPESKEYKLKGIGTGVVISQEGLIITCLHVVEGAERIGVVFGDGTESDVEIVTVQPENDLAVLKAKSIPDDLVPATLRSTKGLRIGDEVIAVGFPFGIGPSATDGVISGLRREHDSAEGQRHLVDLIQFDAAANPGNSGGPLVTVDGDVIGIVTSILNPTDKGFFVGIGFAVPIENAATAAGLSPF